MAGLIPEERGCTPQRSCRAQPAYTTKTERGYLWDWTGFGKPGPSALASANTLCTGLHSWACSSARPALIYHQAGPALEFTSSGNSLGPILHPLHGVERGQTARREPLNSLRPPVPSCSLRTTGLCGRCHCWSLAPLSAVRQASGWHSPAMWPSPVWLWLVFSPLRTGKELGVAPLHWGWHRAGSVHTGHRGHLVRV